MNAAEKLFEARQRCLTELYVRAIKTGPYLCFIERHNHIS